MESACRSLEPGGSFGVIAGSFAPPSSFRQLRDRVERPPAARGSPSSRPVLFGLARNTALACRRSPLVLSGPSSAARCFQNRKEYSAGCSGALSLGVSFFLA
uniref:(northern house mosquito) hypothetical protein n=1 Tax=Culex pipiens TaxID=7175 RepID=A0A8D8KLD9_CULPI